MKLYEVVFQDEAESIGFNLITELVVADNEEDAIEKAWQKHYDSWGDSNKPDRDYHYVYHLAELNEIDGYEIIVGNKIK
jgi:hypothetical protein